MNQAKWVTHCRTDGHLDAPGKDHGPGCGWHSHHATPEGRDLASTKHVAQHKQRGDKAPVMSHRLDAPASCPYCKEPQKR